MIAHHASLTSLGVEIGVVVGLATLFGVIAWRERRRRLGRAASRPEAHMRDAD